MKGYWLQFTDGTHGYCQGYSCDDAKTIAQHLTDKTVVGDPKPLPYPAEPIIWQFEHPVDGKTPAFCYRPSQCKGRTSCPQNPSCTS